MDQQNTFDTPTIARLHRAEYLAGLALASGLLLAHWDDVRWLPAIGLFLYIDLIGYVPGAIAYRRSPDGQIPKAYYVLYNSMHSLLSAGLVVALWAWLIGPEWALLAVPIHLFGDRSLFGNQLKPFGVPFEPKRLPAFDALLREVAGRPSAGPAGRAADSPSGGPTATAATTPRPTSVV
ncbi:hypothetical protein ACLQ3B_24405 [Micromonospora sp. DT53]|uniref:hypothetical protein n=1 Tax=Micromonospora sp. DT53 TaxID=3393444 RepID=UPI003CF2E138